MPHHTRLRSLAAAILIAAFWAAPCRAQFFDDFDGDALAPHWVISPAPGVMEHHVSGGMLHVTDLLYPSNPHISSNTALMQANFSAVPGQFVARANLGWAQGTGRSLTFSVTSNASAIGQLQYTEGSSGPQLRFGDGLGSPSFFPVPDSGMHELMLVRHAGQGGAMMLSAFLNGELLETRPALGLGPITSTSLRFIVEYPNDGMQPFFVDRIQIVPASSSVAILLLPMLLGVRRRRGIPALS